jgi:hypothetical protein
MVQPNIIILDTQKTPFEWNVPLKISSTTGEVPQLHSHTADVFGNYMIVAFGKLILYCSL